MRLSDESRYACFMELRINESWRTPTGLTKLESDMSF